MAGKTRLRAKAKNPYLKATLFSKEKKNMWSNGLRYLRWGWDGEAVQPEK